MKTRVITGVIGSISVLVFLLLPNYLFDIVGLVAAIIMVTEFNTSGKIAGYRSLYKTQILATVVLYVGVLLLDVIFGLKEYVHLYIIFTCGLFTLLAMTMAMFKNRNVLNDLGYSFLGWFYSSFLLIFGVLLFNKEQGAWLLGFAFVGTMVTDIFCYFSGVLFGKHKIIPRISPKKTWEGSIGGFVFCIIFVLLYSFIVKSITGMVFPLYKTILIGVVIGIVGQIGDWSSSYIKRQLKIKDFGKLLPGHGGLLDRLDSLLIILPFIYFILEI